MNTPTIKAIVVRSPWSQEIASGEKAIEYRTWPTYYRGWLAIVAARRRESGRDAGRAVCVVRLVDCVQAGHRDYEWVLTGPAALDRRVEVPGRLGLFELPADLAGQVWAAAGPVVPAPPVPTVPRRTTREIHDFLPRDDDPPAW